MKTPLIECIEVHRGSGNVFADLGLPDAEKLKIKSGLVIEIRKAIRSLGLTQSEAAIRMGITQPKVSDMMRGDFTALIVKVVTKTRGDPRWTSSRNTGKRSIKPSCRIR
jgi:predicted XRE-type DNA-binding protein